MSENIKITAKNTISTLTVTYLDIEILLNAELNEIDTRTYFKETNKFLYLNFNSYHPIGTFKGFLITELKRYLSHSTKEIHYNNTKSLFKQRLIQNNYPPVVIDEIFDQFPWDEVCHYNLLNNISNESPKITTKHLKKFKNTNLHEKDITTQYLSTSDETNRKIEKPTTPIVLTIPFHPATSGINFKKILTHNSQYTNLPHHLKNQFLIGYSTAPNIHSMLVRAKLVENT
jgi:hypothetical protein